MTDFSQNIVTMLKKRPVRLILFIGIFSCMYTYVQAENQEEKIQKIYDQGWANLSRMHKDKGALNKATDLYLEALAMAPNNSDTLWKLAEVFFKKGQVAPSRKEKVGIFEKALTYAEQAIQTNPDSPEGRFWAGCICAKLAKIGGAFKALRRVNRAKEELEICIEKGPDNRFAVLAKSVLADIYIESPWPLKNLEKAVQSATEATQTDPNLTLASKNLAKAYIKSKQYAKARVELERCIATVFPTYIWDAELYDWPMAIDLLNEIEGKK